MEVPDSIRKEKKKSHAKFAKIYGKNKSLKLWRKKNNIVLVLLWHLKLQKLQPQCMTSA